MIQFDDVMRDVSSALTCSVCQNYHRSVGGRHIVIIIIITVQQTEVAVEASPWQPASALLWISCHTLNGLSLKTNNQEGVKLSCHHSLFIPSSLIFHLSLKLMCRPNNARQ